MTPEGVIYGATYSSGILFIINLFCTVYETVLVVSEGVAVFTID